MLLGQRVVQSRALNVGGYMVEYRVGRVGFAVALGALTGCLYLGSDRAAAAAAAPLPQVAQANTAAPASGDSLDQRLNSLQKELDLLKAQQKQQQLLDQQRQQIQTLQQNQTLQQQQIEKLQRENARNSGNQPPPATASAAPAHSGGGLSFSGRLPALSWWEPGDSKQPDGYDPDQDQSSREGNGRGGY